MQVISKDEYNLKKEKFLTRIKNGDIFIYPTDTIYGIGSNALNYESVKKIRKAKERFKMPFSVIAPSKEWIRENCEVNKKAEKWLEKLPGPYTLILKLKNKEAIDKSVNSGRDSLGVRIPDHWTTDIAKGLNIPIVTTSANITKKEFMTSIDNLDTEVKSRIDFMINEGELKGKPSTIIDLTAEDIEIKER